MAITPKLKVLNLLDNDILYSDGDQAEELFFVLKGNVLLYTDLADLVDMSLFVSSD
jgi:CRP-like cAMP-binding protein